MPTIQRLLTDDTGQALVTAINNIVAAVKPDATEIQMSSSDTTTVATAISNINDKIGTVPSGQTVEGQITTLNSKITPNVISAFRLNNEYVVKAEDVLKTTKNVFNGEWIPYGIDLDTGADEPSATNYQHTSYIPIDSNSNYTLSSSMTDAYSGNVVFYTAEKSYISTLSLPYGYYPKTITTPSNSAYMRIQENIAASNTDFQVEVGNEATEYIPFAVVKKQNVENYDHLEQGADLLDSITEVITGKNLFFSEWSDAGYGLDLDTGAEKNHNNWRRTGFFAVDSEETYTASCVLSDAPSVYFFYYTSSFSFISYYQTPYGFYPKTITTPENTAYIRVLHTSGAKPENYQVEVGTTATSYEAPYQDTVIPYSKIYGAPSGPSGVTGIFNKKWLFLGDSITANTASTGWVYKFKELVHANENSFIQAVGGATWCDGEPNIVYNGKPYQSQNYVGNQVAWCSRIGFDSDAFDCIIISAGTNDTNTSYPTDAQVEEQFYNGNSLKPLSEVDRTTWVGCIRWTVQTLREMYPNAVIVLLTPLQRKVAMDAVTVTDMYPTIRQKRETIVKMAHRMGAYCINMDEVNITDMDASDFADGLHPNNSGATKMANYVFRKIMPIMCDYNLEN